MYVRTRKGLGQVPTLHGSFRGTLGAPPLQTQKFEKRLQEAARRPRIDTWSSEGAYLRQEPLAQGRSPGNAHGMLERTRFRRELAGFGEVVVSMGEFGDALAWFAKAAAVPDAVFWLLKQSPTFQSIVNTLDAKYFHLSRKSGLPNDWANKWLPDAEGVFTKGPHIGRRMIEVRPSVEGSFFRPVSSPDALLAADVLHLEAPTGRRTDLDEKGAWLERIAHESIHACRHVLGKRRAGKTAAERIRSGIDDEITTRKLEGKIVGELRKKFPKFAAYQPTTGSFDPWAVERDFFPGKLRLTYLEHFVLNERLFTARTKHLDVEIEAFDKFVDRIPLGKRPLSSYLKPSPAFIHPDTGKLGIFQNDYPKVRLMRRIIDARWRSVKNLDRRDLYLDADLEKMRQEHAKAFFDGLASYTQIP